jgi:hypothetical protein
VNGPTGGQGTAVGDGYHVLVKSLPKGQHTLHFGGTFHFAAGEFPEFGPDAVDFPFDAAYHVEVK